ncbi:hypothetical protein [Shewanella waksmanii]|uniref:hypothetical protein n=1 Tax=Shewanella waksmanii TaxID=213783 RepID=UPI00373516D4
MKVLQLVNSRNILISLVIFSLYGLSAFNLNQLEQIAARDTAVARDVLSSPVASEFANDVSKFSSYSGIYGSDISTRYQMMQATNHSYQGPQASEKARLNNYYQSGLFLLLLAIVTLAVTGKDNKPEFDFKFTLLSILVLSSAMLFNQLLMLLVPAFGLWLLYARRYCGPYLRANYH